MFKPTTITFLDREILERQLSLISGTSQASFSNSKILRSQLLDYIIPKTSISTMIKPGAYYLFLRSPDLFRCCWWCQVNKKKTWDLKLKTLDLKLKALPLLTYLMFFFMNPHESSWILNTFDPLSPICCRAATGPSPRQPGRNEWRVFSPATSQAEGQQPSRGSAGAIWV